MTLQLGIKLSLDKGNVASGAEEAATAISGIGDAAERVAAAGTKLTSAFEQTSQSAADTATSVTSSLEAMRIKWDPLYAAAAKYRTLLGEVRSAHQAGAIDIRTLTERENELRLAYERTTSSLNGRAAAQKTNAERIVAVQTIVPDRGSDISAYGQELDRLRAKFNPIYAAGQQYRRTVDEISQAERVGAISASEASAARERARVATGAQVATIRNATAAQNAHAGAMKLTGFQAANLSYQLNDVFVSLASGQNPMMVAVQQGSQISQIFGGLGNTMTAALGFLTPFRLGIGVVAGLFLGAGKAVIDYSAKMREADVAARGIGRTIGTSAGEIAMIAKAYANAGDVTVDQARAMAVEFTKTGRIGSEQFGRLITIAKDFSATIGTDVETGGKQLADLFADPARGADVLSRSLNLIDESAARSIQRLAETGQVSKAQTALLDALNGRLVKYGDSVAWYTKAWEALANPKTLGGSLGAALAPKSPEENLALLQEQYRNVKKTLSEGGYVGNLGMDVGPWLKKAESDMEAYQRIVDRNSREQAGQRATSELERLGQTAVTTAGKSPANDELMRRIALEQELTNLQRGSQSRNGTAEERERIARAIDADTRALSTWISEADRARELDKLDLALMATRDPIERASLEAERVRVQTRGQAITTTEAAAAAERTYARSIGEVSAQARGSVTDLLADAAARQRVNDLVASGAISNADAAREVQIEAQTRQLLALAARAEGAEKERLLAQAGELRNAIIAQSEAEKRAQALQTIDAGRDRIETLQAELGLVGQVEAERRKVLAILQAEQEIRRQSLDTTSAEAAQIRANAAAEAELTAQVDRRRRALEQERGKQLDRIDLSVMATRDPTERASLEAERARIQARMQGLDETEAAAAGERAYARSIGEVSAQARGSIVDITADAAARAKVNALVASGAVASGDAAREIQIETQTRQLLTAAARAEGAEKERLLGLASQLRSAIIAQAEAEKQAQALQDLQTGRDRIEQLQTELSLIGQAEPVRARALALLEAEQKIRNQGLSGPIADQIRAQARATADLTTALERQKSAWEEIQNTGGSAIDTIVEGFRTGKDVSQQLVDDLSKEFLKLAVSNPLKNAIFGQNLPTISDVGGLLGGLFGGKAGATAGIVPTSVATASINAGTVFVNGTGLAGATGLLGGATTSALPSGLPAIGTDGKVSEAYLKRLFAVESGNNPNAITGSNYGLAQFGYADIKQFGLSNPFDPAQARLATILEAQKNAPILSGILGRSVSPGELYLSHQQGLAGASALFKNPDMPAWQAIRPYYGSDAIAQKAITGNLGSVDMSSKQFTDMWVKKFEGGMDQAGEGLSQLSTKSVSATDALGQFTPATNQAVNALTNTSGGITQASNTLGSTITSTATTTQSAFGQLTSGLSSAFSSLFSGLGNILGGLGNGIGSLFSGLFSFDVGGWTGDGPVHAVSGVTHGQEFVVKAGPAARHRPILEAMNRGRALPGYAGGGWVGSPPARLANDDVVWMASAGRGVGGSGSARGGAAAAPVIQQTIVNQTSTASVTTREESDGKGGRRQVVLIEEAVGNALTRPRSASQKALKTAYGLQPRVTRR